MSQTQCHSVESTSLCLALQASGPPKTYKETPWLIPYIYSTQILAPYLECKGKITSMPWWILAPAKIRQVTNLDTLLNPTSSNWAALGACYLKIYQIFPVVSLHPGYLTYGNLWETRILLYKKGQRTPWLKDRMDHSSWKTSQQQALKVIFWQNYIFVAKPYVQPDCTISTHAMERQSQQTPGKEKILGKLTANSDLPNLVCTAKHGITVNQTLRPHTN